MANINLAPEIIKEYDYQAKRTYRSLRYSLEDKLRTLESSHAHEIRSVVDKHFFIFPSVSQAVYDMCRKQQGFRRSSENDLNVYSVYAAANILQQVSGQESQQTNFQLQGINCATDEISIPNGGSLYDYTIEAIGGLTQMLTKCEGFVNEGSELYWAAYCSSVQDLISLTVSKKSIQKMKDLTWKIGKYTVKGLSDVPVMTNGNSKKVAQREESKFDTPLQYLRIDTNDRKKRDEIIGDDRIITKGERLIDYLLLFNTKFDQNPINRKQMKNMIVLQGPPGMGKGALCHYWVDYYETRCSSIGIEPLVTKFDFASSYVKGMLQKFRSQAQRVSAEKRPVLLFQDELDGEYAPVKNGDTVTNLDVIKELARFLHGEYQNKGNYLVISTVNNINSLTPEIRDRSEILHWRGAYTPEEKSQLAYNSLRDLVGEPNIKISSKEWKTIGDRANQYGMTGRDIERVTAETADMVFDHSRLPEVHRLGQDFAAQKDLLNQLYKEPITKQVVLSTMDWYNKSKYDSQMSARRFSQDETKRYQI